MMRKETHSIETLAKKIAKGHYILEKNGPNLIKLDKDYIEKFVQLYYAVVIGIEDSEGKYIIRNTLLYDIIELYNQELDRQPNERILNNELLSLLELKNVYINLIEPRFEGLYETYKQMMQKLIV